jgi:hypothetical protein
MRVVELQNSKGWLVRLWNSPLKLRHIMPEHQEIEHLLIKTVKMRREKPILKRVFPEWRYKSFMDNLREEMAKKSTHLALYRLLRSFHEKRWPAIRQAHRWVKQGRADRKLLTIVHDPAKKDSKEVFDLLQQRRKKPWVF